MASSRASGASGGVKFVGIAAGAAIAGAAGLAGYALYDSNFRKTLENSIPGSQNLLNYAIGVQEPPAQRLKDLRPLQFSADPKVPPKPFESKPVEDSKENAKDSSPGEVKFVETVTKIEKRMADNPYIGGKSSTNPEQKNENLTDSLKKHLVNSEKATKNATGAKLETIRAIKHHIQTIQWEKKARNALAELVTEANLGGQGETTQLNPLVPISKATATKLTNELDEMISNVKHVDSERIFVHDYSDRVAESRKKFQLELKAVHPNLNYEEGMKLKKSDLQTILAHAHLRIVQLIKRRKTRSVNCFEKKNDLLEKFRLEANSKVAAIPEIDKKKLDEELAHATAEIQKKYDEKLKEVVRTQKQLYDIEHAKDVDDAVQKERNEHSSAVGKALAQLEGIERALAGHLQMDIQNRKSKQMWLATQNLKETVIFGNRAKCFCRIGRRVAYVNDGGALAHLYSWLKSSLIIELKPKQGTVERLTTAAETNFTLLTRAEQLWKSGKKGDAIRVLQMTDGVTRRVAADFIEDARRQQEALLLSRLLLAHAALTPIRSTY
ncbi:hypothetical protein GCK72_016223 [Caenorhabditis remanei]|uniref:MICOS complex subunit MIC60 n=1 Tax=Caenorhabditis remanei TaxID=31234 RepID=A0A6A5GZ07_CAERE|nr:hypothetical protein GCK72_016223 [Caenorhabditis remanei]KAF1759756.1 hypothetical protein GCK72_016223 [Caenorhabditis remanei]